MMCDSEVVSDRNVLKEEEREASRLGRSYSRPDPGSSVKECLSAAEEAAHEVLNYIHPTLDSEEERSDVIDHLRRLIKTHIDCDVFPYGSVPLKTYLPDGDIDLTVFSGPGVGESFAKDVLAVLRGEELNENSEYQISETQFIDAQVKLVKCIVQNIVVDISFNQLGGLSTLCFIEQVDCLVGRNHLFKRSIILIKGWCFYESRILGATHGLISTYALETLILNIFHLFHSSLSGPLAALYTFLDYYSQFDWDNYCISLKGPVCKSSLPNIVVKMPGSGLNDLLLDEGFIENCMGIFSVPFNGLDANQKAFQPKHLNIIDPLKENNNLGRSVHIGNFFRIRSAIKFGARKLAQVLSLPSDQVDDGIKKFFANTLSRHGKHSRSSIEHLDLEFGDEASLTASSFPDTELSSVYDLLLESSSSDYDNYSDGTEENSISSFENEPNRCLAEEVSADKASEYCNSANGVVSQNASSGDRYNLEATNSILRTCSSDYLSNRNCCASVSQNTKSPAKTESLEPQKFHQMDFADSASRNVYDASQKFGLHSWLEDVEKQVEINDTHLKSVLETTCSDSSTPMASVLESLWDDFRNTGLSSIGVELEGISYLADLSGDYDSHLRRFLRGQLTIGLSSFAPTLPNLSSSSSRIQNNNQWNPVQHSVPPSQNHHFQVNPGALSLGQTMCSVADSVLPATAFYAEGRLNTRGTGTYFPSVVSGYYSDRSSQGRGRGKAQGNRQHFHRYRHSNGLYPAFGKPNSFGNRSHGQWKSYAQEQTPFSVGNANQTNGYLNSSCRIEFGSVGNLAEDVISASTQVRGSTQYGLTGNRSFNCNK